MTARPHEKDDEAEPAVVPLDLALVERIRKSLANPRPSIPAEDAFARLDARIAAYKASNGP